MDTEDFTTFKVSLHDDTVVQIEVAINYKPPMSGMSQHFLVNGTAQNLKVNPEPRYILIKDKEVFVPSSEGSLSIGVLIT